MVASSSLAPATSLEVGSTQNKRREYGNVRRPYLPCQPKHPIMRYILSVLFLLFSLSGCGGNTTESVLSPSPPNNTTPPVVTEPVQQPPVVSPPPVTPVVRSVVWKETFDNVLATDGFRRPNGLRCNGGLVDSDILSEYGPRWGDYTLGGATGGVENGKFVVKNTYLKYGGFLLSNESWDKSRKPLAEANVVVHPIEGNWLGLTLLQDENDYREIVLTYTMSTWYVALYAPCYATIIGTVDKGNVKLGLLYDEEVGWTYLVDDKVFATEDISYRNAKLVANPAVGLYFLNNAPDGGPVHVEVEDVSISYAALAQ